MRGECGKNSGITLRPGIVDAHPPEAPLLTIAHQLRVVAVHEQRVITPAARPLARHKVLRHDVPVKRSGIAAYLDLEIARSMARVERPEHRNERLHDCVASDQNRKIEAELLSACGEIDDAILSKGRRERIRIAMIEAERVAIHRVRNFGTIVSDLS